MCFIGILFQMYMRNSLLQVSSPQKLLPDKSNLNYISAGLFKAQRH